MMEILVEGCGVVGNDGIVWPLVLGLGLGHGLGPRTPGDDESGSCEGLGLGASRDGLDAIDNRFVGVSGGDSIRDRRLRRDEASAAAGLGLTAGSLRPGAGIGGIRATEGAEEAMVVVLSDGSALTMDDEIEGAEVREVQEFGDGGASRRLLVEGGGGGIACKRLW